METEDEDEVRQKVCPVAVPSLNGFARECYDNSAAHGWHEGAPRAFPLLAMLAASEVIEAFEEYRAGHPLTHVYPNGHPQTSYGLVLRHDPIAGKDLKPEGFSVEIADCLVRLCDTAVEHGMDLDYVVQDVWEHSWDFPPPPFLRWLIEARQQVAAGGCPVFLLNELAGELACLGGHGYEYAEYVRDQQAGDPTIPVYTESEFRAPPLGLAVGLLFMVAEACGFDLMAVARLKHEYNKSRPFRHGGKRA